MSWDTHLSQGYASNVGKLRLSQGHGGSYALEQLFSSQDGPNLSELLFKVMLANPSSGKEYKIDYVHKETSTVSSNRLALSYGRDFRFEAGLDHESRQSPMYHNVKASLVYPGKELRAGMELGDRGGEVKANIYYKENCSYGSTIHLIVGLRR